ncbi:hypothetical protein OV079_01310 [Nannocystis pusilla]|uniref:Uncharacterized protein n=1 Tax=Nannocystis pusilla TaxID=889268 RepID=A0A9X3ITP5_9BACT|nr:hypothetical protein [Nannocystis pusilla]MCY1004227.1 hypothetical protein [Nannocystis pusilla]
MTLDFVSDRQFVALMILRMAPVDAMSMNADSLDGRRKALEDEDDHS